MALESAMGASSGLIAYPEWLSREEDKAKKRDVKDEDDPELTPEEQERFRILRYCTNLYDDARKARQPFETFDVAWDLFSVTCGRRAGRPGARKSRSTKSAPSSRSCKPS
jgi:hypothetical protein